jgi:hypothetical protein
MKWNETINGETKDMFEAAPGNLSLPYWTARKRPSPGNETVVIPDTPGFYRKDPKTHEPYTGSRTVDFELIVESHPDCKDCTYPSRTVKARQVMNMTEGVTDWNKSGFWYPWPVPQPEPQQETAAP